MNEYLKNAADLVILFRTSLALVPSPPIGTCYTDFVLVQIFYTLFNIFSGGNLFEMNLFMVCIA